MLRSKSSERLANFSSSFCGLCFCSALALIGFVSWLRFLSVVGNVRFKIGLVVEFVETCLFSAEVLAKVISHLFFSWCFGWHKFGFRSEYSCSKIGLVGGVFFLGKGSGQRAVCLTKRAPDAGDSARFPSLFLRLSLFLVGRLRRPRPSAGNANR